MIEKTDELKETVEGIKRKRGRPPKAESKTEEIQTISLDEKTLVELYSFPFDFLSNRYGEFWKLADHEKELIRQPLTTVANKWVPELLKKYFAEISLLSFSVMFLMPRIKTTMNLVRKEREKEKENAKQDHHDPGKEGERKDNPGQTPGPGPGQAIGV